MTGPLKILSLLSSLNVIYLTTFRFLEHPGFGRKEGFKSRQSRESNRGICDLVVGRQKSYQQRQSSLHLAKNRRFTLILSMSLFVPFSVSFLFLFWLLLIYLLISLLIYSFYLFIYIKIYLFSSRRPRNNWWKNGMKISMAWNVLSLRAKSLLDYQRMK